MTQLSRVRDRYRPGAAFIDAQSELPGGVAIDQRSTSGKAHSIREGLIGNREAFEALRRYAQGPLFGEGHYWRARQWDSFESGLWDGRHRGFGVPVTPQGSLVPNRDAPVIPDFELSAVFPRAAGHHGMGWEGDEHWGPGLTFPVDGTNGRATAFVDSYFVNTITYGHAPYVGSNGAVLNNYWTLEGTLRSAVLVGAVQELLSRSRVATVRYVDGAGAELTLSEALLAPLDLANARVHVTYESGAQLWANHDLGSGTSWSVVAPHLPPSQTAQVQRGFSVPGNGFVVSDGRGFLAFSATPEGGEARMDYVRAPGRWEAITGRGVAATYDGFPQAAVLAALPPGRVSAYRLGTVVRNDVHNLAIGASGGLWHYPTRSWFGPGRVDVTALGAQPAAVALSLRVQRNALRVGAQVGLSARVAYANDAWRDLTPLASFQVMPAGIVSVDQGGAALGLALGTAVVTATWDPDGPAGPQLPLTSAPVTLVVQ